MADPLARLRRKTAWKRKLDDLPTTRACGACDLCCTILEISELQKPAWSRCSHLKSGGGAGCGIWGSHPAACKNYVCLWRLSDVILPQDMFPADCGFMLTIDNIATWPTAVNVCVEAGRGDVWDSPRNRGVFARLASAWNCRVVVVTDGVRARQVFTPMGSVYNDVEHPHVFTDGGRTVVLQSDDYGPDRRPPEQRIPEQAFTWLTGAE